MGRFAVRSALGFDFVEEVAVADRDGAGAERFAGSLGAKARALTLDVTKADELARALADADVVLNSVGPFYRFGVPVLRAAIDAGCHYLDINDDWEPTLEMLDLDDEARAREVSAVVGLGASPGVSNLLAVKAMAELDATREVVTGWSLAATGGASGAPSAALVHWLHQCSGTIRILEDGAFDDVAPLRKLAIDYPGVGRATAWSVGHPEAVTLPRERPELRSCVNVMTASPAIVEVVREIAREIDAGRLTPERGAELLAGPEPQALRQRRRDAAEARGPRLPPLFALARGTRDGRPASAAAAVRGAPAGGMGGATGVPLAVGLALLARGRIARRGVFAPEDGVDPDAFFDALAPLCSPPLETAKDLVLVTRSTG